MVIISKETVRRKVDICEVASYYYFMHIMTNKVATFKCTYNQGNTAIMKEYII